MSPDSVMTISLSDRYLFVWRENIYSAGPGWSRPPDKIADFKIFSEDRLLSSSNSERMGEQDYEPSKLEESDTPGSRSYM